MAWSSFKKTDRQTKRAERSIWSASSSDDRLTLSSFCGGTTSRQVSIVKSSHGCPEEPMMTIMTTTKSIFLSWKTLRMRPSPDERWMMRIDPIKEPYSWILKLSGFFQGQGSDHRTLGREILFRFHTAFCAWQPWRTKPQQWQSSSLWHWGPLSRQFEKKCSFCSCHVEFLAFIWPEGAGQSKPLVMLQCRTVYRRGHVFLNWSRRWSIFSFWWPGLLNAWGLDDVPDVHQWLTDTKEDRPWPCLGDILHWIAVALKRNAFIRSLRCMNVLFRVAIPNHCLYWHQSQCGNSERLT